jgi:putative transposase
VWTGKPALLKKFDYIGLYRYFLTFCTFERRVRFTSGERVDLVRTQFSRSAMDEHFAILAYCFMPDHVHLLVEGLADSADCRTFIKRSKQLSGFHYKKNFGETLWQRYGYERTLRDDEVTLSVARYIVENPLRAGLSKRAEAYPFLGSTMYSIEEILQAVQLKPDTVKRWSG